MLKDESIREKMFSSIASWQSSDLSQKEWCQQQNIAYHIFHYWYKKYKEEQQLTDGNAPFVRLTVKSELGTACEVVFNDGTKVIFREPISVQYLKSLLF